MELQAARCVGLYTTRPGAIAQPQCLVVQAYEILELYLELLTVRTQLIAKTKASIAACRVHDPPPNSRTATYARAVEHRDGAPIVTYDARDFAGPNNSVLRLNWNIFPEHRLDRVVML
jgi:hypothetical protein